MSPLSNIIFTLSICGLVSVALFIICVGVLFVASVGHTFGGPSTLGSLEAPLVVLSLLGLALSLAICPFGAFYARQSALDLTPHFSPRLLIFSFIAGFQIIILTVGYYSLSAFALSYEKRSIQISDARNEPYRKILNQFKESNIEIVVKNSEIVRDDGKTLVADVTLQIRNIPFIVPSYRLTLLSVNKDESFIYKLHNFPDGPDYAGSLEATNENGKWIFRKSFTEELISDNADKVTFQIEITRLKATSGQLPETITPQLTTWKDEKGFWKNQLFWREPIPIPLKKINRL
jgi:hypothetical protein